MHKAKMIDWQKVKDRKNTYTIFLRGVNSEKLESLLPQLVGVLVVHMEAEVPAHLAVETGFQCKAEDAPVLQV